MIELDGSLGEGGGQILRSSLTLALVTGQAFHLRNVRARREKPGLQPQHLMSVQAAARIGQAQAKGASLHSTDLVFQPGDVTPGAYHFAIGTAGNTGLVLHTLYLPLAWRAVASSQVTIEGGTHVQKSPCFHFLQTTWRGYMEQLGLHLRMHMRRPGFYPRGGGRIDVEIEPCPRLGSLQLPEVEAVTTATGFSAVAGLPSTIATRQARRATTRLEHLGLDVTIPEETWPGGPGTVLAVVLPTRPVPTLFFGLGARGKPAERVADEAVDQVEEYLAASPPFAVDAHSADQLVLPLTLADGPSSYRVAQVTRHLLTNIDVIRHFIDRPLRCEGQEGEPGIVQIA